MRKIKWEVTEDDVAVYAKEFLEIELTDWQLLNVMDKIEMQLEKIVITSIEEITSLDE
jgi:hypothetical protein